MLRRNRIRSATPPSLVKWPDIAAAVNIGSFDVTPNSDQVPQLRKAQSAPEAGSAATALAVSCDPTAKTRAPKAPVRAAISGATEPRLVPGVTIDCTHVSGIPSRSRIGIDRSQLRRSGTVIRNHGNFPAEITGNLCRNIEIRRFLLHAGDYRGVFRLEVHSIFPDQKNGTTRG